MQKILGVIALSGVLVAPAGKAAYAQPPVAPERDGIVSPAEVQRMFDAYALVQAQDQLKLSDSQFPQFLARFKALQEIRRRSQAERGRIVQELVRLSRQDQADEEGMKDRLKELKGLEARSAADIRNAYDAVDQVLNVRQQARFRILEEQMERRKIELVTRARQNRLRNRQ